MDTSNIIRRDLQQLKKYAVQECPSDFIKLDAMEFPYEMPEAMKKEWLRQLEAVPLRRYPHLHGHPALAKLKATYKVPGKAEVILGNGSDELLQLLTLLVATPGAKVLSFNPTFSMYELDSRFQGLTYLSVDCNEDLQPDFARIHEVMKREMPHLIFIAYPNNPTGIRYDRVEIEKIIADASGLVVIDEAYGAFAGDSFLNLAGEVEHLVVVKTLSKIGFAGIRLGFAAGHPKVMRELSKITPPYNISQLSLATLEYVLEHFSWVKTQVNEVKYQREVMLAHLEAFEFLEVYPSETNFLTVRVPDAGLFFSEFYRHKILVKNLHGTHPLLENCLRLTIGTPAQNERVLNVIKGIFQGLK